MKQHMDESIAELNRIEATLKGIRERIEALEDILKEERQ